MLSCLGGVRRAAQQGGVAVAMMAEDADAPAPSAVALVLQKPELVLCILCAGAPSFGCRDYGRLEAVCKAFERKLVEEAVHGLVHGPEWSNLLPTWTGWQAARTGRSPTLRTRTWRVQPRWLRVLGDLEKREWLRWHYLGQGRKSHQRNSASSSRKADHVAACDRDAH